jgi:hypothetical protein
MEKCPFRLTFMKPLLQGELIFKDIYEKLWFAGDGRS